MAISRKNLSVNALDFDTIKNNIKVFLREQDTFKDYDFDGSGLTVLLDILSYFTHYQGIYNNLTANELFLDSAVKRSSLVSHAKSLGYTPRSVTAPVATVNINFSVAPTGFILNRGRTFRATVNGKTYNFTNLVDYTVTPDDTVNGGFVNDVEIRQGVLRSKSFIVPSNNQKDQKFTLPDSNVDTKTIKVQVLASSTDNSGIEDVWDIGTDYNLITESTNAYFIQEDFDGTFSIYFGDGVVGRKLEAGNIVSVSYLKTDGAFTNGIGKNDTETNRTFTLNSNSTVTTVSPAAGGGAKESITSIRYNAPKSYASQNRAITTNDFESLISSNFSGFKSVYVFGGENADPPQFGKVLVALNPNTNTTIPSSLKKDIEAFLRTKCSVAVTPDVIDPVQMFFRYAANVVYDPSQTTLTTAKIQSLVRAKISEYFDSNTINFFSVVSLSRMIKDVLESLVEVESVSLIPYLEQRFEPNPNTPTGYQLKFQNPIFHPHEGHSPVVSSNSFGYVDTDGLTKQVFVDDDGRGRLRVYELEGGNRNYLNRNFGSILYDSGILTINTNVLSVFNAENIRIRVEVGAQRLVSNQNHILTQDVSDSGRAIVNLFLDDRPDRRVVTSTATENAYVGTSSISSVLNNQIVAEQTQSDTRSGRGRTPVGDVRGDQARFDPIQVPDTGGGGY